jgi:hypothetical protein
MASMASLKGASSMKDPLAIHRTLPKFFEWVGRCITEWAHVERVLFHIFEVQLGTTRRKAALIFYRRSRMISDRLAVTGMLIPPEFAADWKAIEKRTRALLQFRNHIAHNPVKEFWEITSDAEGEIEPEEVRWVGIADEDLKLIDADPAARLSKQMKDAATLDRLQEHHLAVQGLRKDLMEFLRRVSPAEDT